MTSRPLRVAALPEARWPWIADVIHGAGARMVPLDAAETLVWCDPGDVDGLRSLLDGADGVDWIQLPIAGIERYLPLIDDQRVWTCAKGVYAEPVAEMALALILTGLRSLHEASRRDTWGPVQGRNLFDRDVLVVGGGGVAEALIRLLAPWRCRVTVVRKRLHAVPGAHRVVPPEQLLDLLPEADVVVLASALTGETVGLIDREALRRMRTSSWLVNVARGAHVVTDDLVHALAEGEIAGAALDVTDPEPLPFGHPLWSSPRCLVTSHASATLEMSIPLLSRWIGENLLRRRRGEPLIGVVDPSLGY